MKSYIIGIDLGGTNLKAALFDSSFNLLHETSVPTEAAQGPEHVLARIKHSTGNLLSVGGIEASELRCIGLGIPGLLDPVEGLSIFSPNFPGWEQIHVAKVMRSHFDVPVFIDNDVRTHLHAEWRLGAGAGLRNVMLVAIGTGVGSGIVVDGRMLYGATSSVGEIGHINMFREGRPCRCGSSGCLSRYVCASGMVNTVIEKLQAGGHSVMEQWVEGDPAQIKTHMISDAYDLGDQVAIEVMKETGTLLGYGLASVINLLNPEMLIVGGGVAQAGERLLGPVRETALGHAMKLHGSTCRIVQAKFGSRAGMIGAAVYAADRLAAL